MEASPLEGGRGVRMFEAPRASAAGGKALLVSVVDWVCCSLEIRMLVVGRQ